MPVDTTVVLAITADVIHPGGSPSWAASRRRARHLNEPCSRFPASAGTTFRGQCAELCGAGHADMRAAGRAVTPGESRTGPAPARVDPGAQEDLAEQAGNAKAGGRAVMEAGTDPSPGRPAGGDRHGGNPPRAGWPGSPPPITRRSDPLHRDSALLLLRGREAWVMRCRWRSPTHSGGARDLQRLVTMRDDDCLPLIIPLIAGFGNYLIPLMIAPGTWRSPGSTPLLLLTLFASGVLLQPLLEPPKRAGRVRADSDDLYRPRRRGRVDLPHPPDGCLDRGRRQLVAPSTTARSGHDWGRMPHVVVHSRVQLPADRGVPSIAAAVTMLITDRHFGTASSTPRAAATR